MLCLQVIMALIKMTNADIVLLKFRMLRAIPCAGGCS